MADDGTFQVEVVSAEKQLLSVEAEAVYARSLEGEIGILPGHQPALLLLEPGSPMTRWVRSAPASSPTSSSSTPTSCASPRRGFATPGCWPRWWAAASCTGHRPRDWGPAAAAPAPQPPAPGLAARGIQRL